MREKSKVYAVVFPVSKKYK